MTTPSILFLCTGNCCRSQMAEALMRDLAGDRFNIYSAGSHPAGYIHPLAILAMAEFGLDIAGQTSKGLDELGAGDFDIVVTVCDHARAQCPTLAGRLATRHWPLDDPAAVVGDEEAALAAARRVRDEIKSRLEVLLTEEAAGLME